MKTIMLVTNSFPFGIAEASFIRPEIGMLSRNFEICVVARNVKDKQTTQLPKNVSVVRYNAKKRYSTVKLLIKTFCSADFYRELWSLCRNNDFCIPKLNKLVRYCMRAFHFAHFLYPVRKKLGKSVILYTYWNDYSVYSLSLIKQSGDKLVSRIHRADLYLAEDNDYYFPLKIRSNRKTDLLAFISKQGMRYFRKTFCTDIPAQVFYLGVKSQKNKSPFSKKQSLNILSFSYLSPVKRVSHIVELLEKLSDIRIQWVHIGSGVEQKKVMEDAQTHLLEKENISYTFIGSMENEEALQYISEHEFDFLLNVSESEGVPVTMMECMSFGIPVIATNVGGVSELVEDGQNGFLLSSECTFEEFYKTVHTYLKLSYADKCSMRENALETWKNKFDEEKNIWEFSKALEDL